MDKSVAIDAAGDFTAAGNTFACAMTLLPRVTWEACLVVTATIAGEVLTPNFSCSVEDADPLPA